VGQPEDDAVVTPLISMDAADYVQELIDDAVKKGAAVLAGNRREGSLIWPTLVDGVTTEMRLAWEEPFGPVLPIIRVRDAAEAVTLVNNSAYGLQTSIFTRDVDVALRIAEQLEVGTVQINGKTARGPDHFPFLGTKSSGMGTQGVRYSLEAMTRLKAVVFNVGDRTNLDMVQ
jgi:glyceraldehyde-3-phosphate dehydrogenase (NADP+)